MGGGSSRANHLQSQLNHVYHQKSQVDAQLAQLRADYFQREGANAETQNRLVAQNQAAAKQLALSERNRIEIQASLTREIERYKADLNRAHSMIDQLTRQNGELLRQLEVSKRERDEAVAKLDQFQRDWQKERAETQEVINGLQKKHQELSDTIARLMQELMNEQKHSAEKDVAHKNNLEQQQINYQRIIEQTAENARREMELKDKKHQQQIDKILDEVNLRRNRMIEETAQHTLREIELNDDKQQAEMDRILSEVRLKRYRRDEPQLSGKELYLMVQEKIAEEKERIRDTFVPKDIAYNGQVTGANLGSTDFPLLANY